MFAHRWSCRRSLFAVILVACVSLVGCPSVAAAAPSGRAASVALQDQLLFSPKLGSTLHFGATYVGSTSDDIRILIVNGGSTTITPNLSVTKTPGWNTDNFVITQSCDRTTFGPTEYCQIRVVFRPVQLGRLSAGLKVSWSGGASIYSLEGVGLYPFEVSPTNLDFGDVDLGGERTLEVTITNDSSGAALTGLTGGIPTDNYHFPQTTTCDASLGAGASCVYSYTYRAIELGRFTATATLVLFGQSFEISLQGCTVNPGSPCDSPPSPVPTQPGVNPPQSDPAVVPAQPGGVTSSAPGSSSAGASESRAGSPGVAVVEAAETRSSSGPGLLVGVLVGLLVAAAILGGLVVWKRRWLVSILTRTDDSR